MTKRLRIKLIATGVIAVGGLSSPANGRAERIETGEGTYCEVVADFTFCPPNNLAVICGGMGYPDQFGICLPSLIEPGVYTWICCRNIE